MKHWKPEHQLVPLSGAGARRQWTRVEGYVREVRRTWPAGATAGLLLVAAGCIAIGIAFYQVAGPRDVFAN